jgi:hypothetical protein
MVHPDDAHNSQKARERLDYLGERLFFVHGRIHTSCAGASAAIRQTTDFAGVQCYCVAPRYP